VHLFNEIFMSGNWGVTELSLEVQGGHDYFRFVEGTCIIALCLSSLSLSLSLSLSVLSAAFSI